MENGTTTRQQQQQQHQQPQTATTKTKYRTKKCTQTHITSGPMLHAIARLSQRYLRIACYGIWGSLSKWKDWAPYLSPNHVSLGCHTPFAKTGISAIFVPKHMKTRNNGCISNSAPNRHPSGSLFQTQSTIKTIIITVSYLIPGN